MAGREWGISRAERGSGPTRRSGVSEWGIDGAIARRLAAGPATRAQLLADGVPADAIDRRVRREQLKPLWPAVYLLAGTPITPHLRHEAALLACGPRAVLSSLSAAVEWAIVAEREAAGALHVTVPPDHHRRPAGVTVHRTTLERREVRRHSGLLLTSPARTLQDLAATHPHLLERAVNEAYALRLLRPGELQTAPGRRGARHLRATLDARAAGFDRSRAERMLLELIGRAGLPLPVRNARLGRWELDLLWPDHRLVVETDGYGAHSGPRSFERDREKDRELALLGHRVVRFTWRDLTERPERVVATLARLLA